MSSKQSIWALVIGVAFVIILGATYVTVNKDAPSQGAAPVAVGAIVPLTGEVSTYGDSLRKGFDLAADKVPGRIRIVYEDSKANPTEGITAMQKLLSQGVRHFLGDATSGVSLALAPNANANKVLLMISIATSDALTDAGPYVFRNCPPNSQQAVAASDFIAKQLQASRVAIISKENPYAANLAMEFRKHASAQGLDIVLEDRYAESMRDFSDLVEKLRAAAPDAAFIPGNYEDTARFLRKARELGLTTKFVGTDGAYSPKLIETAGEAADGFFLTMLGIDKSAPFYQEFAQAYNQRFDAEPDVFAAYGYEGASILFDVATKGGSMPEQRERLANGLWPGLLGDVQFDEKGQVVRPVGILQVVKGGFHSL